MNAGFFRLAVIQAIAFSWFLGIISPLSAQDSGPGGADLLVRQQIKTQQIENELRDLRGSISDNMQDIRARLSEISSRLDEQTIDEKQSIQKTLSSLASLEDTISLLEQRMRRTIEMSSDLDFRIIRLENKLQTLLSLSSENISSVVLDPIKKPMQSEASVNRLDNQPNLNSSDGTSWVIGQQELDKTLQEVMEEAVPTTPEVANSIPVPEAPVSPVFSEGLGNQSNFDNISNVTADTQNIYENDKPAEYLLPEGTIEEQYQFAVQLALAKNLDEAAKAFDKISKTYSDEPRAADALFFLGRVQYMQKQYELAAYSFSEFNMNYPNDSRLIDSTLFLAKSVGEFADSEQACPIFESLPDLLEEKPQNFLNEMKLLSEKKQCKKTS